MRYFIVSTGAAAILLASSTAFGDEPAGEQPAASGAPAGGAFLAGAKVGGLLSFAGLDPNVRGGVELGYVLPWLRRSFAVALEADYANPQASGSQSDPRVDGNSYSWKLSEQILALTPLVMYRLTTLGRVTPYAAVGPRIYMLKSTVKGSLPGGASIPETTEQSTSVGFGLPVGVEVALGPGALTGELLFEYGSLDHTATGSSNTGMVSLQIGYRFLL